MDDFDLYGDLELGDNPFSAPPVILPAPTLTPQVQLVSPAKPPAERKAGDADAEDSEAVQALLQQLHAARDSGLFADFDLDLGEDGFDDALVTEEPSLSRTPGSRPLTLFPQGDEPSTPAAKRARPNSPASAPTILGDLNADTFDFEAEMPTPSGEIVLAGTSSPSELQRSCGRGDGRSPGGAPKSATDYWYNPTTKRWEPRDAAKEAQAAEAMTRAREAQVARAREERLQARRGRGGQGKGGAVRAFARGQGEGRGKGDRMKSSRQALNLGYKSDLCWQFNRGFCKKGERCFWAHGRHELRSSGDAETAETAEMKRKRILAECLAEARSDAEESACEFAQAVVVRLALRFEDKPEDMLSNMAQAGLPAGEDQRTTVKALMRLCHPDKCQHPEAKRAVQILGPLLSKK